jgi:hypothetical protein
MSGMRQSVCSVASNTRILPVCYDDDADSEGKPAYLEENLPQPYLLHQ